VVANAHVVVDVDVDVVVVENEVGHLGSSAT